MSLHTASVGEAGEWIVFCHGLFGQGRNWSGVAKSLSDRHRCLMVDLPQHGRSPWQDDFDYADMADRLAEILHEHAGDDPVALVGHSMGGKVAMLLALRHPTLVDRLCVVDMSPVTYPSVRQGGFSQYVEAMRGVDLGTVRRRADADEQLRAAVPDDTVRGFLLQNLRHLDTEGRHAQQWRWQMNLGVLGDHLEDLGGWPEDRLEGVTSYDGPVLWVRGERSDYVLPEHQAAMERWFPRVRKVTIKGAGHWVHSEAPAVFTQVLRQFVDAAAPGSPA